jgi:aldehyde dehydrogenase (NAD+)
MTVVTSLAPGGTDQGGETRAGRLDYAHVDTVYVNGAWVAPLATTHRIEVTDPATGTVWGSVPAVGQPDVDRAVAAARANK